MSGCMREILQYFINLVEKKEKCCEAFFSCFSSSLIILIQCTTAKFQLKTMKDETIFHVLKMQINILLKQYASETKCNVYVEHRSYTVPPTVVEAERHL